jgi:DNA polymerase III delta prime subunit
MSMQFTKAVRKNAKLRLAIGGPSGAGKTTAALQIAKGLGGRTAVIDTERGSASLYSDQFSFDTLELLPPYSPEHFIEAIDAAEAAGYDVCIIDSATHEWDGAGGCLEINEKIASAKYKNNTWSAWSETTPRHRAFIDRMIQSKMHVIITLRSKTETVQDSDKRVKKVGMKLEQRSGTEYEFTVVFEMDHGSYNAVTTKDRTRLFVDPAKITEDTGKRLMAWLNSGVETPPTEAELTAKRREDFSFRFAQSLNPDGDLGTTQEEHDAAVAASVFAVHSELREHGIDEYQAVWNMIPAPSRAALKKYIDMAKKSQPAASVGSVMPAGPNESAGAAVSNTTQEKAA